MYLVAVLARSLDAIQSQIASMLNEGETPLSEPLDEEQRKGAISNLTYFIMHEIPGIRRYTLPLASLKQELASGNVRVLPAGGHESRGEFPHRCAGVGGATGNRLGRFPGGHGGYRTDHQAFAKKLCELLDRERR